MLSSASVTNCNFLTLSQCLAIMALAFAITQCCLTRYLVVLLHVCRQLVHLLSSFPTRRNGPRTHNLACSRRTRSAGGAFMAPATCRDRCMVTCPSFWTFFLMECRLCWCNFLESRFSGKQTSQETSMYLHLEQSVVQRPSGAYVCLRRPRWRNGTRMRCHASSWRRAKRLGTVGPSLEQDECNQF